MLFIDYSIPRMLIADQGKKLKLKTDEYVPAGTITEDGTVITEAHYPHYASVVFVAAQTTREQLEADYEEIKDEDMIIDPKKKEHESKK